MTMPKAEGSIPLTVDDLRDIAAECQLILPDGEVTPELIQYTHAIVGICAGIADQYGSQGPASEKIFAMFGLS